MKPTMMSVTLSSPEDIARFGGQKTVMLSLSPADVTTSQEIDSYLPGYVPFGGWRADEIANPNPLVDIEFGTFRRYGSNNVFRRRKAQTSRTAPVGEVDPETDLGNYQCLMYGFGSFIPASVEGQSKYDVKLQAAELVKDQLTLDREVRLWSYLTTSGNWASGQVKTLGAGFNWNGGVNSNPILDLQAAYRASFQPITAFYMGTEAGQAFINNDQVRDYVKLMNGQMPNAGMIAQGAQGQADFAREFTIPGLPPIKIAGAKVLNESTLLLDEIIGRTNVVGIVAPPGATPRFNSISTVKTFRTKGPSGTGYTSREYFVNNRGVDGGTMLVAGFTEDVKFVANTAGALLRSVLT